MHRKIIVIWVLVLLPYVSSADTRWFAGADIAFNGIKIETETFQPISARARFGGWIWENIGIEVIAGGGVSDNDQAGLTLEASQITSIAARFQSPLDLGMKAYVLLGYAENEIDGTLENSDFPGKETFTGGMAALGGLWPLTKSQDLSLSLEFSGYLTDEDHDIAIGSLSLGLLYDF
jgi:hypothetical protein